MLKERLQESKARNVKVENCFKVTKLVKQRVKTR